MAASFMCVHIFRQGFVLATLGPQMEAFFPAKTAKTPSEDGGGSKFVGADGEDGFVAAVFAAPASARQGLRITIDANTTVPKTEFSTIGGGGGGRESKIHGCIYCCCY